MAKKKTILDVVYEKYRQKTNMTPRELRVWAKNPLSKKVSPNRKPLMMAIRLRSKPKRKWTLTEIKWALQKTIPYLKRANKQRHRRKRGYTRNQLMLKNWGYDIKKKQRR